MKLEEWIRKDMTRFIKDHEPESDTNNPIRHEDYGLVAKADYERRIKRALEQGRFKEATIQFDELKKHFTKIPTEHQEERKRYHRILQICYKLIYDYVEDMHKTHRLLHKLDNRQDVFDQNVAPQDLNQETTSPENAPPSIEDQMFAKHPSQPAPRQQSTSPKQQQKTPSSPQNTAEEEGFFTDHPGPQAPQINFQSPQQAPQQIIIQQAPAGSTPQPTQQSPPPPKPPTPQPPQPVEQPKQPESQHEKQPKQPDHKPTPDTREEQATREEALNQRLAHDTSTKELPVDVTRHAPSWEPPRFEKLTKNEEPENPKQEQPPRPTDQQILEAATKDLLTQATHALQHQEHQEAKTKLLEARFEAQRTKNNQLLRAVEALERQLAASQAVNYHPKHDRELFSSAYLQGVQAMRAGNYHKAAQLFAKRTQQAPGDTAARIRYKECMEALNDTTTR